MSHVFLRREKRWGAGENVSLFSPNLLFSNCFSQPWLSLFSSSLSYFMSQYFKFAPKEHSDLLRLPNLDIYCNLSKMIINFSRLLCYVYVFWSPVLATKIDGQGTWLKEDCPRLCQLSIVTATYPDPGLSQPSPLPLLNWPTLTWPNVIFLNWMQLHLGRVFSIISPFDWKLLSIPSLNQKVVHA